MDPPSVDRRVFLSTLGRCAGGACLACHLGAFPAEAWSKPQHALSREIDFYDHLDDDRVQCRVCPLHCTLSDGETCFCRTRTNRGGRLLTKAYSNPCLLRIDPIEKLPLNHFRPGTRALTMGIGGCNLRCLYCQNWQQSQKMPDQLKTFELTPEQAVSAAKRKGVDTIAFGYTEPVAFLEYVKDTAVLAHKAGLHVAVATAAFVEPEPLLDLAHHVDAFAIGLKGFDDEFYYRALGVKLKPVLKAIRTVKKKTKCWLELINLVVPTYNDAPKPIGEMCRWIRHNLGGNVPLHFARFVPMYRLNNLPRTPVQTLDAACAIARNAGLRFVYTSNIAPHSGTNTYCPNCHKPLIQRLGFKIIENTLKHGVCPSCHKTVPGVWS
ncbi:MAG: AmmeMemoRadiSam system radical SAM enzyme [Phycisphaerae bacterium]